MKKTRLVIFVCALLVLFTPIANAQIGARFSNASGSSIAQYDVVVLDGSGTSRVKTTTTAANGDVVGVAYEAIANNASGVVVLPGSLISVNVTGTVAVGDPLVTSTTAGRARASASTSEDGYAFALATQANASGTATIKCLLATLPVGTMFTVDTLIVGPASATDNALVRFDATTGKLVQNSSGILSDAGALSGITVNADVITAGTVATARLGSGTANSTVFLRGDSTWASPTATLANGDYGDVTVSSSGTIITVDNNAITYAKIQTITADRLLGNDSSGTAVEEIPLTSAGRALLDDSDASAQRTTLGGVVVGAASSTDNAVARFDGTGGKTVQNSSVVVDDSNNVSGVVNLAYTGKSQRTITAATIASGAVTITSDFVALDTEGAASTDDLDTINGGVDGQIIVIVSTNSARDITIKNNTGNIRCGADIPLSNTSDTACLIFRSGSGWKKLSSSVN